MKRFDFADLYFAVAFTILGVTLVDISVTVARAIALVMVLAFIPVVELYDAIKRRYEEHLTRAIMKRGVEHARRYGL